MNDTLLVITTYNQSEYTKLCFDSIRKLHEDIDVLVVDDCSTDDTILLCKEYGYEVITKKEGKGLTDSWNRGYYEFKKNNNYKYLILANNDILIPTGAISELIKSFQQWPYSLIVPLSTKRGVGHNEIFQSIDKYFKGLAPDCDNPLYYQITQDRLFEIKKDLIKTNDLYKLDTHRVKMFNGFFFMMNRNIINYEQNDKELFKTNNIMTNNEDQFNWDNLITNNDFAGVCKSSFIYHYKGVSTFDVFDNYSKISNDVKEWKRQRDLRGG